jgi:UV DNA damage endonuclease
MARAARASKALAGSNRGGGLRLGYACVNTRLPSSGRTVRLANATPARLRELVSENLAALEAILRWNEAHGVEVFRVTSNLIPFGSHPANELQWWDEFAPRFHELAAIVRSSGARLSTHPGQYTVLSSSEPRVVSAAIAELEYHARLLTALGCDQSSKIVLHAGGSAGPGAASRFEAGFSRLGADARARLVLENDERWPLEQVLELSGRIGAPVVFDLFHHQLSPSFYGSAARELVLKAGATWFEPDGRQKVHFSTQAPGKRRGAHADQIDLPAFAAFVDQVGDLPLDCMVEVKDKERSIQRAAHFIGLVPG